MSNPEHIEEIDLTKYWLILQRRWLPTLGIVGIALTMAFGYVLSIKPTYKAQGSILIRTNRTSSLTGLGGDIGRLESLTQTNNPVETQAKIVASVPVIQKTIRSLDLKDNQGKPLTIEDLTKNIKVEVVKGSEVMQISFTHENAQLAANVVNQVMDNYITENIRANRAEAESARKFIISQLPISESSVRAAESAFRQFQERNKIIILQEQESNAVKMISSLEDEIAQAEIKLTEVNAQLDKLRSQAKIDTWQAVTLTELSKEPRTQQMLTQLREAETKLAVEQNRYLPGHPTLVNLQEQIASLKKLLQQRIKQVAGESTKLSIQNLQIGDVRYELIADIVKTERERVVLERKLAKQKSTWAKYRERANALPKLAQTQRELERRLKASQTTYETLLTRLQEIHVAENQNMGNARIISTALVPDKPGNSRKLLILGGAGFFGLLVGIIAALALDLLDQSVKNVKQAKEIFGYTLLGVIPQMNRSSKSSSGTTEIDRQIPRVIGRDVPSFPMDEVYQMLQANLKFLSDRRIKAIAVTSSIPKEGKSEVSANLAVAMAQVGRKVLLIDADMRHPIQHHIWGITNAKGLSNIIVDQVPFNTLMREVMPNLFVITSGVLPPNPVALLDSQGMESLVINFAQEFDCIIFDTPPLVGIADAAVLGKLADGILLVVRPEVLDLGSAQASKEFLQQSHQRVLGMVLNGVNVKHEPDSYFYYSKEPIPSGLVRNYSTQEVNLNAKNNQTLEK
ncbi:GumC family protein [Calothrix sp. 336/3]|uniref:GumC family protein n=1 Tax=Calothrix sp. 336/3 TaxID=1337936 RepID=UPI0004E455D1|nr:polysaccharide biosynthesis tyrosine autokinase [Calothrix sp. 336/3]AKG21139.1 lipopolysaccharide biosynthesis protein [Calothrix sp. 336/3]